MTLGERMKKNNTLVIERAKFALELLRNNVKKDKTLSYIEVHLNEHCNLNCAHCIHFCPLAKEEYYDLDIFQKDFKRLAELTKSNIKTIHLLGGEPLLNKDINKYMQISRKYFPNSNIAIVTNGVLLLKMKSDFWESCKKFKIDIWISAYPIKLDYKKIAEKSTEYDVKIVYSEVAQDMFKTPLNLKGDCDPKISFQKCLFKNGNCYAIKNGRIYVCQVIPNIYHFNEHFNKNLQVAEEDYIDIYKAKNLKEILDFLSKPCPFCRYCDIQNLTKGHKWRVSNIEINEWV
jgi:MoaA/NifB/PqqE/SkfB family radical SAM enzyme